MKRLTTKADYGSATLLRGVSIEEALNRLAEYEGTGLTPAEVAKQQDTVSKIETIMLVWGSKFMQLLQKIGVTLDEKDI